MKRTTLTLDDDIAAMLEQVQARKHVPFRQVVNEALRDGLTRRLDESESQSAQRNEFEATSLGGCLIGNIDNIQEVIAITESETFK